MERVKKLLLVAALTFISGTASAQWIEGSYSSKEKVLMEHHSERMLFNCRFITFRFYGNVTKYVRRDFDIKIQVDDNDPVTIPTTMLKYFSTIKYDEFKDNGLVEQMKSGDHIVFEATNYMDVKNRLKIDLKGFDSLLSKSKCYN